REAVATLEELARKGRSYGIHLILASQTIAGIEALYTKRDSIFGQFPLRVALPGGSGVLDVGNPAADGLSVGTPIISPVAGRAGSTWLVRLPHADPAAVAEQRRTLWLARPPASRPPPILAGLAERRIEDDPGFAALGPRARRLALVGRVVDVELPPAS